MIARVGLIMVAYVSVGMFIALVQLARTPEEFVALQGTKSVERSEPISLAPIEDPPELMLAAPATSTTTSTSTTSTSTVDWQSGRLADHTGANDVPVALEIPAINVVAEVVQSGIDPASHQMAIPPTPSEVGWYRYGPTPGEAGSAVIAGHVDMAGHGPGAFFELDRLPAGSRVIIHMSDGSRLDFEVVETTRVPKAELDVDDVFDTAGPARVTLITCGGAFNQTERTYLDNVVASLRPTGGNA